MVWIVLMKNDQGSTAPGEVDARIRGVIKDFIRSARSVQRLNHLPRIRIYDHKLPRIDHVSASEQAAHEQAMVNCVKTRGMGLRAYRDRPLGNNVALVGVDHIYGTLGFNTFPHFSITRLLHSVAN